MALHDWIADLNDDYIAQWSNKGLLRRGRKQLEKETLSDWNLSGNEAVAQIGGFAQTLDGVGFGHLKCGCPATETCFHLTCFLLGLQKLSAENSPPAVVEESTRDGSDQLAHEQEAECEAQVPPWIIFDESERQKRLGKASINRAMRWINLGVEVEIVNRDRLLTANILESERVKTTIPRIGGVEASVCSCRKKRCPHMALLVLLLSREAGAAIETNSRHCLGDDQRDRVFELKRWLSQFTIVGIAGMSRLMLEQGEALATELRQVDLPRVSQLQSLLCQSLRQDLERQLSSSHVQQRQLMAKIVAYTNALSCSVLPQSLHLLGGEHRRLYRITNDLSLIGVSVEQWLTPSGFRGYTVYFYAPANQQFYAYSETRNQSHDPNWRPRQALLAAKIGEFSLEDLAKSQFQLSQCWTSSDYRISSKNETKIAKVLVVDNMDWTVYAQTVTQIANKIISTLRQSPYGEKTEFSFLVEIKTLAKLTFDPYQQRWLATAVDSMGVTCQLRMYSSELNDRIAKALNRSQQSPEAIFGIWIMEEGILYFRPISTFYKEQHTHLSLALDQ